MTQVFYSRVIREEDRYIARTASANQEDTISLTDDEMTNEEAIEYLKAFKLNTPYTVDAQGVYKTAVAIAIKALELAPCEDCISREEALAAFRPRGITEDVWQECDVYKKLTALPSVRPTVKTGQWVPIGYDGYADGNPVYDYWECSNCGWEHNGDDETLTAYCPNCGRKMEVQK